MPPSLRFARPAGGRKAVSELYASMLMLGVTLSVGGLVSYAAVGQFGLAADSAMVGASLGQTSAGVQLGLVLVSVASSTSCPSYAGYSEGTALTLSLYNYGTSDFTPVEIILNSTAYPGAYGTLGAASLGAYTVTLSSCAHPAGQTIVVVDSLGDEVEFGS